MNQTGVDLHFLAAITRAPPLHDGGKWSQGNEVHYVYHSTYQLPSHRIELPCLEHCCDVCMNSTQWRYLAEGNANVIFQYIGNESLELRQKVLRLRKRASADGFDASALQEYLSSVIIPVLGSIADDVLLGTLVSMTKQEFEAFNTLLDKSCPRPVKFRGSTIDTNAKHGLLLPLLNESSSRRILEFKPKWLTQSPNAPRDAIMCRTCAVRLFRQAPISSASSCDPRFCPLDLASHDQVRIGRALDGLNVERSWDLTASEVASLAPTFLHLPLIERLAYAQAACGSDIALAMTLRDCSVYIEMDRSTGHVYKFWIADLDRKSLSKSASWQTIEDTLKREGWYHGKGLSAHTRPCIKAPSSVTAIR